MGFDHILYYYTGAPHPVCGYYGSSSLLLWVGSSCQCVLKPALIKVCCNQYPVNPSRSGGSKYNPSLSRRHEAGCVCGGGGGGGCTWVSLSSSVEAVSRSKTPQAQIRCQRKPGISES